nr:uncharacterized protein LOC126518993 isoform X5 [Dermacentor andersoni]
MATCFQVIEGKGGERHTQSLHCKDRYRDLRPPEKEAFLLRLSPVWKLCFTRQAARRRVHGCSAVLDNVRSNVDETFHRINLLSKQDLRKIMRDARVSKTERLHDNDYVSVQLWVERMHSEKENPLLFFKHQGQPDKK